MANETLIGHELVGVVLCGGRSLRFGTDKSLFLVDGVPLYQRQASLLEAFCKEVVVSCRKEQSHQYDGWRCVEDRYDFASPMNGLLSVQEAFEKRSIFLLATDYPSLRKKHLRPLVDCLTPASAIIAYQHSDGSPEPLCTIYHGSTSKGLQMQCANGQYSLREYMLREGDAVHYLKAPTPWKNMNWQDG
ncbi:MAG: molybdenum cofactor guanylyltransferase [Saprospiraceae bacterium]|nr:molybdenum cofactor guanylyltransferase [Saprospiraceae bacterium]